MTHIKVKLTKLSDNQNALRTNEVIGITDELPVVGKSFVMTGEGLEFGTRMIWTSEVMKLNEDGSFNTQNSVYKVEVLEEGSW